MICPGQRCRWVSYSLQFGPSASVKAASLRSCLDTACTHCRCNRSATKPGRSFQEDRTAFSWYEQENSETGGAVCNSRQSSVLSSYELGRGNTFGLMHTPRMRPQAARPQPATAAAAGLTHPRFRQVSPSTRCAGGCFRVFFRGSLQGTK